MSLKRCMKLMLVLLTVVLILGLMNLAQAQPKSGFSVKGGYFMPGDQDVEDIWGSGFTFGAGYLYVFPPYGIDLSVEYFSKEEPWFGITYGWRVIPVDVSFLYLLPQMGLFSPYIGGGIEWAMARVDVEFGGVPFLAEEESGLGIQVRGGFALQENFFAEAKYSTVDVEGVNAGGFTILAGYRF